MVRGQNRPSNPSPATSDRLTTGKTAAPSTKTDIDKKLSEVRILETDFFKAVERSWSQPDSRGDRSLDTARDAAPEEYRTYKMRAEEAAVMVGECTGNPVGETSIEPTVPG